MEISLIRHGKSKCTENNPIAFKDFNNWVNKYDCSGVFEENNYPSNTIKKVADAKILLTSDLTRAIESANILNSNNNKITNSIFRETELPVSNSNFGGIKLTPGAWTIIFRSLWLCGFSANCESLKSAKLRANEAATTLIQYATKYESVALIGHGFFNMLIAKQLLKMGWTGIKKTNTKHWSCSTYSIK